MNPLVISSLAKRHSLTGHGFRDDAAALICRLAHDPVERAGVLCDLQIDWRPAGAPHRTVTRTVRWDDESPDRLFAAEQYHVTHQEREVTGRAAVVVFALLIHDLEGLQVQRVVPIGGKGDYWVDEVGSRLAEVSGIRIAGSETVDARANAKFRQLFENPLPTEGFVCVTMFSDASGAVCGTLRHSTRQEWEADQ